MASEARLKQREPQGSRGFQRHPAKADIQGKEGPGPGGPGPGSSLGPSLLEESGLVDGVEEENNFSTHDALPIEPGSHRAAADLFAAEQSSR